MTMLCGSYHTRTNLWNAQELSWLCLEILNCLKYFWLIWIQCSPLRSLMNCCQVFPCSQGFCYVRKRENCIEFQIYPRKLRTGIFFLSGNCGERRNLQLRSQRDILQEIIWLWILTSPLSEN
jgi:hypothetical protein